MDKLNLSKLIAARSLLENCKVTFARPEDGVALMATHKAADTLIEIVQAALKWDRAQTDRSQVEALNELHRLLAKVEP